MEQEGTRKRFYRKDQEFGPARTFERHSYAQICAPVNRTLDLLFFFFRMEIICSSKSGYGGVSGSAVSVSQWQLKLGTCLACFSFLGNNHAELLE